MGIHQSEFGFPYTHHEKNYIEANLELAEMGVLQPIKLSGWCPMREEEIKESFKSGKLKHVNLSISTSQQMTEGKFSGRIVRNPEENPAVPNLLDIMAQNVQLAKKPRRRVSSG